MVFVENNPKTKAAARKGGLSGKKHLQTMSKAKLKKFTSAAGKRSGEVRRAKKAERDSKLADQNKQKLAQKARRYEDKIMSTYLM